MISLFKDGDCMAIRTDARDDREFLDETAEILSRLIESGAFKNDWEFQLQAWLPQIVEIACKMRGYKADVTEERVLISGRIPGPSSLYMVAEFGGFDGFVRGQACDAELELQSKVRASLEGDLNEAVVPAV